MTKKWFVRFVAILMAAVMVLSVIYIAANTLTATAAVTQAQIDKLKQQKKDIEKKKSEIQSKINSLEYEQSSALAKKRVLDDQITYTQAEIDNITEQIETYEQLILVKEQELVEAQAKEDAQWVKYKANMRTMEENGTISYVAVIFESDSFTELLSNIDMVGSIMAYGEQLYEELRAAREATAAAKATLEQTKAEQEIEKQELEIKRADLLRQQEEASALLQKINADIAAAKDLYKQEEQEAKRVQEEINRKIAEMQASQTVVGTGTLIWPAPSCTIVTSTYGRRFHPIYKEYRMHTGIDIGAKYGASIVAADTGKVITSAYSSSYGNYIVISHGKGVTTLYAHLSSRLVKEGATVTQGQQIGKCGSTGNSTGPHLHFEVMVNGARQNPLQYYSNYTIRE
jgi:murein DD-endopeptidase MepM/ murein hydrolase activator NlpD